MSICSITSATQRDLQQLNSMMFELHDEHHALSPDLFKSAADIETLKSISRYLDTPECLVLCARQENRIVGFITGHFCELNSTVSKAILMGSIDELYVVPEYRQLGIAKALISEIESRLKECGAKQLFVEVWQDNPSAMALYQSSGFSHHINWLRKPI